MALSFVAVTRPRVAKFSYVVSLYMRSQALEHTLQTQVQFRNTHETDDQAYVDPTNINLLSDSSWISHAKSIRGVRLTVTGGQSDLEGLYYEVNVPNKYNKYSTDYYYVSSKGYVIRRTWCSIIPLKFYDYHSIAITTHSRLHEHCLYNSCYEIRA